MPGKQQASPTVAAHAPRLECYEKIGEAARITVVGNKTPRTLVLRGTSLSGACAVERRLLWQCTL